MCDAECRGVTGRRPPQGEPGSFDVVESRVRDSAALKCGGRTFTGCPPNGTAEVTASSGGHFAEGTDFSAVCVVCVR